MFGHILYESRAYHVEEIEKGKIYVAIHTEVEWREKWCRVTYKLQMLDGDDDFECECGQFAHI
jgi:hypothetical protein